MLKLIASFLLLLICFHGSFAQTAVIKGVISDTIEKKNLSNSVVMVLRQKDSIMVGYTRSDKSGNFKLNNLPSGKLLILVTYPKYADYVDQIELKDSSILDLHQIMLTLKSQLLKHL